MGNESNLQRRGFTLLEVIVAIAVMSIVMFGARAILDQVGASGTQIAAAATDADRAANAEWIVRGLIDRTVAADSATPFTGTPVSMSFTSWCDVPDGWREPCGIQVAIVPDSTATALIVRTSTGHIIRLREHATNARLRYIQDVTNGGHWLARWLDPTNTPVAVGFVSDQDTLTFRIGGRR